MVIVVLCFLVHSFVNVLSSCAEIVIKKIDSFFIFLSQIKLPVEIHRHQLAQIHDRNPIKTKGKNPLSSQPTIHQFNYYNDFFS